MIDPHLTSTLVAIAFAAFVVYRRARRNIGRQVFNSRRLVLRVVAFSLIGLLVLVGLSLHTPPHTLEAITVGALAGAALGWFGVRHTDFEFTPEGNFYTPHLYIGLAVTLLLVGRMAYRLVQMNTLGALDMAGHTPPPAFDSPLTLGILFLTIAYYIVNSLGLLQRLRSQGTAAPAV